MPQLTIDMPLVSHCTIVHCAYNVKQGCHAKAITIGDVQTPGCDTFFTSSLHSERIDAAGVGACKVSRCRFNRDFECTANEIEVGNKQGKVLCLTFNPR